MDLYLESFNTSDRRTGPPKYPPIPKPTTYPPPQRPPPPPHIQQFTSPSNQNTGHISQNRPNPQVRPPPPPPMPHAGGYQGRGRPH